MDHTLTSKRCRIVPVSLDDIEKLHSLWILPGVRKYLWDDEIIPKVLTEELVEKSIHHLEQSQFGLWLVHLLETDAVIGFGGFWPFHQPERIELVFGLAPDYWGTGYATEIAHRLVQFGKEKLSMATILASTDKPNIASIAVLKRLGMEQTHYQSDTETCFFALPG